MSSHITIQQLDRTIEGDDLVQKAQDHMKNQTEVIIQYRSELIYSEFRTENGGLFLTSIEPAKKEFGTAKA